MKRFSDFFSSGAPAGFQKAPLYKDQSVFFISENNFSISRYLGLYLTPVLSWAMLRDPHVSVMSRMSRFYYGHFYAREVYCGDLFFGSCIRGTFEPRLRPPRSQPWPPRRWPARRPQAARVAPWRPDPPLPTTRRPARTLGLCRATWPLTSKTVRPGDRAVGVRRGAGGLPDPPAFVAAESSTRRH